MFTCETLPALREKLLRRKWKKIGKNTFSLQKIRFFGMTENFFGKTSGEKSSGLPNLWVHAKNSRFLRFVFEIPFFSPMVCI